jgi:AAA domain
MREGEAPSYFNPVEASVLVGLVAGLLQQHARSGVGVRVGDIGVIATYRKQVARIANIAKLKCCSIGYLLVVQIPTWAAVAVLKQMQTRAECNGT